MYSPYTARPRAVRGAAADCDERCVAAHHDELHRIELQPKGRIFGMACR